MTLFEEIWFANVLRSIAIMLAGVGIVYACFSIYYFVQRWYFAQTFDEEHKAHLDAIFWHVVLIFIPTAAALTYTIIEMLGRLNMPLAWRTWFFVGQNALFLIALRSMTNLQGRKARKSKELRPPMGFS